MLKNSHLQSMSFLDRSIWEGLICFLDWPSQRLVRILKTGYDNETLLFSFSFSLLSHLHFPSFSYVFFPFLSSPFFVLSYLLNESSTIFKDCRLFGCLIFYGVCIESTLFETSCLYLSLHSLNFNSLWVLDFFHFIMNLLILCYKFK